VIIIGSGPGYYNSYYNYYNANDDKCRNMTCDFCCVEGVCQTEDYCKEIAPSSVGGVIAFIIIVCCCVCICYAVVKASKNAHHDDHFEHMNSSIHSHHSHSSHRSYNSRRSHDSHHNHHDPT